MTVRVIRLIEYVYPDHEVAEKDMGRWGLPANGRKALGLNHTITSATMPPRTANADEATNSTTSESDPRIAAALEAWENYEAVYEDKFPNAAARSMFDEIRKALKSLG